MRDSAFYFIFAVTAILQILVNVFLHLPAWLTICILPALIALAPLRIRTPFLLIIAFITAFLTDFLTSGILGLTVVSLLPVAFLRNFLYKIFIGKESFTRKDDISSKKHGLLRISGILVVSFLVYFLIFVLADSAGTRPLLFNGLRILCSMTASYVISLILIKFIAS